MVSLTPLIYLTSLLSGILIGFMLYETPFGKQITKQMSSFIDDEDGYTLIESMATLFLVGVILLALACVVAFIGACVAVIIGAL